MSEGAQSLLYLYACSTKTAAKLIILRSSSKIPLCYKFVWIYCYLLILDFGDAYFLFIDNSIVGGGDFDDTYYDVMEIWRKHTRYSFW